MKINLHRHGHSITGIAVLGFLFITSCVTTSASINQTNETQIQEVSLTQEEIKRQEETRRIAEEAREAEQRAAEVRGTIQLYSDFAGTVLINGEETQFYISAEYERIFTIENAVGKECTLAVRDSAGIVHQASSRILIESSSSSGYTASIINLSPNDPADFDVIQNASGITITSYKGTRKKVIIPETLHGQRVTAIGTKAFERKGILSVVIPNSMVTIGNEAFRSNVINEVVIPNSVTSIGEKTFQSCGLTKVTIGRGVRFIDYDTFGGNNISELIVLAPLTEYDRKATGKERVSGILVDTYSQSLGLHPNSFGSRGLFGDDRSLQSLTRVTLPANIHDNNLQAFPEGLVGYYKSQGKRAGIYVLNGPVWSRE